MEYLLHYTWKHRLLPLKQLVTTDGQPVEIIDPGLHNTDAGPDFFNAKLKIGDTQWVGNVEIHQRASDWNLHKHHTDKAYENVVLHVVETNDMDIATAGGRTIPTLVLPIPENVRTNYAELMRNEEYPPCHPVIPHLPKLTVNSFLSALQAERLTQKADRIANYRLQHGLDWENAFFITLARNFGFGINGEAFEQWARLIPLRAVDKHRDNLFQIEAIFFGQAGLLNHSEGDEYYMRLQREFRYLVQKFDLHPMDETRWKLLRTRPTNFPHIRLAQLAHLYHHGQGLLSKLLETKTPEDAIDLLHPQVSDYWQTHYTFDHPSPKRSKQLSRNTQRLLVINTVSPFLYAYGRHKDSERLCQQAINLLEQLPAENNRIIRIWQQCGLQIENAADSQALIQLKREYCDCHKCLQCRIGYEYLRRDKEGVLCHFKLKRSKQNEQD